MLVDLIKMNDIISDGPIGLEICKYCGSERVEVSTRVNERPLGMYKPGVQLVDRKITEKLRCLNCSQSYDIVK